jgi:hypothetical protein
MSTGAPMMRGPNGVLLAGLDHDADPDRLAALEASGSSADRA